VRCLRCLSESVFRLGLVNHISLYKLGRGSGHSYLADRPRRHPAVLSQIPVYFAATD
jgi:hypothetical protein